MGHLAVFWSPAARSQRSLYGLILGLFALVASRFGLSTLYPIWTSAAAVWTALFFGFASVCIVYVVEKENSNLSARNVDPEAQASASPAAASDSETNNEGMGKVCSLIS